MVTVGLMVRLEAQPGKSADLEARMKASLPSVEQEPGTIAWLALRLGPTSYAVVDVFPDDAARQAHLEAGAPRVAALAGLLAGPPTITTTDVIAAKLPRPDESPDRPGAATRDHD
jgi:quinol monooxygenase YgiN